MLYLNTDLESCILMTKHFIFPENSMQRFKMTVFEVTVNCKELELVRLFRFVSEREI